MSIFPGNPIGTGRRTPRGAPPVLSRLKRLAVTSLTLTMLALCLSVVGIGIGQALPTVKADGTLPTPTNFRFTSAAYYTPRGASMPPNSGVIVNMAWEQSGNYSYFLMQRSSDGGNTWQSYSPLYGEMFSPYIYDDSLAPTTLFCYRVMATYQAGGPGDASSAYTAPICTVGLVYPPTPTLNVPAYNAATSSAQLSWSDSGAGVSVPQGWIVQRSTATTGWATIATLTDGNLHSYTDSTATPGTLWYYRLVATNQGGSSGYSVAQHAGGLGAPSGLTVTANQPPNVSLSWQGSAGAANYHVERSTPTTGWQEIGQTGGTATTYTDTNAPGGTLYYYRVWASATNGLNNSDYSVVVNTHAVPATPANLTAQAVSTNQVNLSWSAGGSYTGQGYYVERKLGTGGTYSQIAQVATTATTFSDSSAAASNQYYYRLRSFDSLGYSPYSVEVAALTFPGAPAGLTATGLNGQLSPAPAQQINLSWQPSTPAGNIAVAGYHIQRKQGANRAYSVVATVNAYTLSFADTVQNGLVENTAYTYRVSAYNASGDSSFTGEATATTAPNAPSSLTASVANATPSSNSSIALSWTNNSTVAGLSGFKIEQALGSGSAATNWQEIGSVGPSVTTFTASVKDGTTYSYRVRAYNSAGLYSAYTAQASATPPLVAPTSLTVTTHSFIELDLAWASASTGASGFKVERKQGATGTYAQVGLASVTTSAGTNPGSFTFRDIGLAPGQTYFYRVRATSPYADSAYSGEASSMTPAAADLIVTQPNDDGSGQITGTLSYALTQAESGQSIAIQLPAGSGNAIVVAGGQLPAARNNVTIAGSCGASGVPGVTLTTKTAPLRRSPRLVNTGSTTGSSSGFSISGDVLYGLSLNLPLRTGPGNLLRCVAIHPAG